MPDNNTPRPDEYDVERSWADRLGMDFNPGAPRAPKADDAPGSGIPWPDQAPGPAPVPSGNPASPGAPVPMPPTCLVWAVLSTLCCCMPLGIVAIVFSAQVGSKWFARDYEGARRASDRAQAWVIASIVAGIIVQTLYLPLALVAS